MTAYPQHYIQIISFIFDAQLRATDQVQPQDEDGQLELVVVARGSQVPKSLMFRRKDYLRNKQFEKTNGNKRER